MITLVHTKSRVMGIVSTMNIGNIKGVVCF